MTRLIDADALYKNLGFAEECKDCDHKYNSVFCESSTWQVVCDAIYEAPTIDAVPVVWCKDCKYWDKDTLRHNSNDVAEWDECECEMLARRDRWNEIDRYCCGLHFCADGEREDDECNICTTR